MMERPVHAAWMLVAIAAGMRWSSTLVLVAVALPALGWWVWQRGRGARWGLANAITTVRAGIVAVIAGLAPEGLVPWGGALLVAFWVLDGVDGWWARRSGTTSSFGAAFDQEVDALMVAVVSTALAQAGLSARWVVLVGALRYGYVLVVWLLRLRGEAPRSTVARLVFGGLVLAFVVAMLWPGALARSLVSVAGALVVASFARSLWWSWRGPGAGG